MTHAGRLEQAVMCIYPEIQRRVASSEAKTSETVLWKELSCCILSSQVKYPLAVAAAELLEGKGHLLGRAPVCVDTLENTLRSTLMVGDRPQRYRFPQAKAHQLASTHRAVHAKAQGLSDLLEGFLDATDARRWFVAHAAGMGPKQASMFLRNTGITYGLAVLDRHVLDYMSEIGLSFEDSSNLSSLNGYSRREEVLKNYASGLGMAVGLMDWAIWIVMRVFKRQEMGA
ncbi:thermostable 8-oxoguanine DNA glycosylase [Rhizobium leguminosarum bv. trifolii WSM597]|uniref:Thermostable 8-oxoguanine DNA glycosylase n=1 Tax=Rhizobium leguminosarum bv. trifolii WSM597 TaxID=754764 RepID=J0GVV4_RHILT|nr:hypothetical protein [Rhizobium leguminosarum]EJB01735.1 thermostable 8-oxoguanine DNA glycosylase [Rhizobium leguminosarum bv. trifolii WSM597]